jgi:predicted ATP-binding protein involved in virulence
MSKVIFHDGEVNFRVLVRKLQLEAFRGFQGMNVELEDDLTVFISKNGGGKTTILDALWEGLSFLDKHVFRNNQRKSTLSASDVKNGNEASLISMVLDLTYKWFEEKEGENMMITRDGESSIRIQGNTKSGFQEAEIIEAAPFHLKSITEYVRKAFRKYDGKPVFKYYHASDEKKLGGQINVDRLSEWINRRQKVLSQKDNRLFKLELKWVIDAVNHVLSDEEIHYSNLHIDYRTDGDYLAIQKKEREFSEQLTVSQLSSGEKTLLGLVSDLTISLIQANPDHGDDNNPLQNGYGVVLIDEVGVHLHPSWQRKVLPKLQGIFPNVQFIVTTHSPLVIGGINQKQGRLIKNFRCLPIGPVEGRDASSILEDEFGEEERPHEYQEKLERFYRLLNENKDEAETILKDLKKIWGDKDEEIIRAESYLDIF